MSFVSRAIKKVFDFGKKVVRKVGDLFENKWFRTAFLVGLTFFTAGLGSAGFAGFGQSISAAGGGIGGFFSAVGNTIATGFGNIVTSVKGAFSGLKEFGTAAKNVTNVAQGIESGIADSGISGPNGQPAENKGFFGKLIGSIFSESKSGDFLRGAITGGISLWAKNKAAEEEQERRNNATVAGGPAFGGSPDLPAGFIRKPVPQTTGLDGAAPVTPNAFSRTPSRTLANPLLGQATQINNLDFFQDQPLLGAGGGGV